MCILKIEQKGREAHTQENKMEINVHDDILLEWYF